MTTIAYPVANDENCIYKIQSASEQGFLYRQRRCPFNTPQSYKQVIFRCIKCCKIQTQNIHNSFSWLQFVAPLFSATQRTRLHIYNVNHQQLHHQYISLSQSVNVAFSNLSSFVVISNQPLSFPHAYLFQPCLQFFHRKAKKSVVLLLRSQIKTKGIKSTRFVEYPAISYQSKSIQTVLLHDSWYTHADLSHKLSLLLASG